MQAFKFNSTGKLLMTLGKKGVMGDNTAQDTFNGMADIAVAKSGDIFISAGVAALTMKSGVFAAMAAGAAAATSGLR